MAMKRKLFLTTMVVLSVPMLAFAAIWFTLPSIDDLHLRAKTPTTKILDRHGRLLYEIIDSRSQEGGRHTPLPLERVSLKLRKATLAVEDANFYNHPGVDVVGVARAMWINLRGGDSLSGGSTITQQLARMMLLDVEERQQRTLLRKLREALLAFQIAQRYDKDDILALYLNETYYGNLAYGVEAASRSYFGKSASELDLSECALLAGLPQSPARYDPFVDLAAAKERQTVVLDLMHKNGMIDEDEMLEAKQARVTFAPAPYPIRAPHFVSYVRGWLENKFGVERVMRGGLIVTTTLDLSLNEAAEDIIRVKLKELSTPSSDAPARNANNAALVALDPRTGEVIAMVGSPNYFDAKTSGAVNATLALRQPGSAFKPITYAAAMRKFPDFTAASPIIDVRTAFPTKEGLPYVPVNYDRRHHGVLSAREALATSNNIAAVKVMQRVGVKDTLALANALGLRSLNDADRYGLALTLGGGEVRLIELTSAYGAFANNGNRIESFSVVEVTNTSGESLFTHPLKKIDNRDSKIVNPKSALDPRIAWLITDILSDNAARAPAFGEGSVLKLNRPAAVKTGTTTDFRDNWTIGYTPQFVVGVWVGNADGASMRYTSGVSGAGPIWRDFMEIAHRGLPELPFEQPAGLTQIKVCALSGLLPTPECTHTRREWFIDDTQPTQPDTWHKRIDGQIAFDLPLEAREWAKQQGWKLFLVERDKLGVMSDELKVVSPDDGAVFRHSKNLPNEVQLVPIEIQINEREVIKIEVVLDDAHILTFEQTPFRGFWKLRAGGFVLRARAFLRDGRTIESAPIRFRVLE
jgi:penicillin-binding protein 1C